SDDLNQFAHVHPAAMADGTLVVRHAPVTSGDYRVFADFLPVGGTPQLLQQEVFVGAARRPTASLEAAIAPDLTDKVVDGLRARIDIEPRALSAGNPGLI